MHLVQSARSHALREGQEEGVSSRSYRRGGDATLINEQMVVTVDARLLLLGPRGAAVPGRTTPYECTEQTLNRFVSGHRLVDLREVPVGRRDGEGMSRREGRPPRDVGRRRPEPEDDARGEPVARPTPAAAGGGDARRRSPKVLDPRARKGPGARVGDSESLRKAQTSIGGFPGGRAVRRRPT